MNIIKDIYKIAVLLVMGFLILNLNSCDVFVKDGKKEANRLLELNNKISTNRDEAKLLVQVSQDNLDVLELCDIIKEVRVNDTVINIVNEIKEEQLEMHEKYNDLATNNVISIPSYSSINNHVGVLDNADSSERHLKLMVDKINNQIQVLEKLSDTTNNDEFKNFVQRANTTLRENLDKTKETLQIIRTNS